MAASIPINDETAEGITAILTLQNLTHANLFWPHSALSRQVLPDFFNAHGIKYCDCIFYDTFPNWDQPPPDFDFEFIDEIVFTSPSTVNAFLEILGAIPWDKEITAIGPITQNYLDEIKNRNCPNSLKEQL